MTQQLTKLLLDYCQFVQKKKWKKNRNNQKIALRTTMWKVLRTAGMYYGCRDLWENTCVTFSMTICTICRRRRKWCWSSERSRQWSPPVTCHGIQLNSGVNGQWCWVDPRGHCCCIPFQGRQGSRRFERKGASTIVHCWTLWKLEEMVSLSIKIKYWTLY